jgi:hypothetical protein
VLLTNRRPSLLAGLAILALTSPGADAAPRLPDRQELSVSTRRFYLDGLIRTERYRPGKNSFIIQNLEPGERRVLADLRGGGSVRHMWTTWAKSFAENKLAEPGLVWLRIFVDGEETPSVSGPIDEVFRAAERTGGRYVPQPAFNFEGSFNLYLPVFFSTALRIEIEARGHLDEFYAQIDYRTTERPERRARLVSESTPGGLVLGYRGEDAASAAAAGAEDRFPDVKVRAFNIQPGGRADMQLGGPAIIRFLSFEGAGLEDLDLELAWDGEGTPSVRAPLEYLFGGFQTAALDAQPGRWTCYFPMPYRRSARLVVHNRGSAVRRVAIGTATEAGPLPPDVHYFHAVFREEAATTGFRDVTVLAARGEGHFVGLNLFDSGHNHGGGDTALIDADLPGARVLHGICGEDYFSFAWHRTGAMHALAGAPAHERRFRHHLENPYPFRSSFTLTFGMFAGLRPKSVAFWYQRPEAPVTSTWKAIDAPWQVFGPIGIGAGLPSRPGTGGADTEVPLARPEHMAVRWEPAEMRSGFLDLTHHYRHFLMTAAGTGFVAGRSRFKVVTAIHAARAAEVNLLVGHDDGMAVTVNGRQAATLEARVGFQADRLRIDLVPGWNELALVLDNEENTTWRWSGVSLAVDRGVASSLRLEFASPAASPRNKAGEDVLHAHLHR